MGDISRERITRIERIEVHSPRPRDIGFNARKGAHGMVVDDSVVRVHTASGAVGVGLVAAGADRRRIAGGAPPRGAVPPAGRSSGGGRGDRPAAVGLGRPAAGSAAVSAAGRARQPCRRAL